MFVPFPSVIVPDPTIPLSPAGLGYVALVPDGHHDLAAFERSVAGYVDFAEGASGDALEMLGSYRTAVTCHLPVDIRGSIDGVRRVVEACKGALASLSADGAGRPDELVVSRHASAIQRLRRRVERALSGLLRTYEQVLAELHDLLPVVTAPEYKDAYANDVEILERVLDVIWGEAVSVAGTALTLSESTAALEVTLAVPRSLYSDVDRTTDLVLRTLRDADESGCRLVGHLIIDLAPADAT